MFGPLTQNEIEQLIHQKYIARLGCHADDTTYVVPISYGYDGEYIYGRTQEGMKVAMMRKNPKVCFQVDDMPNLSNWKSVIAWGEFEELTSEEERRKALNVLMARTVPVVSNETMRFNPQWPFPSDSVEDIGGIVYRIKLVRKSGRFERSSEEYLFAI